MADPLLHIKDSYYFEVPKFLWPRNYDSADDFPDVWIRLDPEFQRWEAERLVGELRQLVEQANEQRRATERPLVEMPATDELLHTWEHWQHADGNHGKPLDVYLERNLADYRAQYRARKLEDGARADQSCDRLLSEKELEDEWFVALTADEQFRPSWGEAQARAGNVDEYRQSNPQWSEPKIAGYNHHRSGKIVIPQPFGELRNLYEKE